MQNILVIGFSTRNVVCSANRAGYTVCSIDAFRDLDLQECAYKSTFLECRTVEELHQLDASRIKAQMSEFGLEFDAVVPGSGLEMLDHKDIPCPVLANSPDAMQKASDKLYLSKRLEALGIPHPRCYSSEELDAIEYPIMIKPVSGGGGIFNRVARNRQELLTSLEELYKLNPELTEQTVVIQEFLEGIPSSVSLLSTKNEALSVAVNEQLIGIPWLSRLPFAYCGNITPFRTDQAEEMEALAEELVLEFKLLGSNGVDFLVSKKGPAVLEINPRFQGSLDTVEKAMNINIFEAHVGCFRGDLPEKPEAKGFAARGIIYSDRELFIDGKLMDLILREKGADIPCQGTVAEPDGPLTSLFACTSTREEAVLSLKRGADRIKVFIKNQTERKST
ncbi:MAG: ATP-grasp domain-containing protein [Methanosarcina flavescens]|jgi:predicted ATP-grasp superfamily ATP-dependent carboligase|uniref:ATP-grasp domain-containing protein n=1 Tax=Methanosarcina flavescens TaxID=1715806 RepID=A0A660HQT2_9EURY|nr:ATP-grasp domain-containing protein [Methanosarcina flavescens]AYK14426.1 ATP-grasp domain-containing protein [Methanosarcina flavescens]NLK32599.1 ATP-grasp domain-containing protein [Methanosarcina flavescens]